MEHEYEVDLLNKCSLLAQQIEDNKKNKTKADPNQFAIYFIGSFAAFSMLGVIYSGLVRSGIGFWVSNFLLLISAIIAFYFDGCPNILDKTPRIFKSCYKFLRPKKYALWIAAQEEEVKLAQATNFLSCPEAQKEIMCYFERVDVESGTPESYEKEKYFSLLNKLLKERNYIAAVQVIEEYFKIDRKMKDNSTFNKFL